MEKLTVGCRLDDRSSFPAVADTGGRYDAEDCVRHGERVDDGVVVVAGDGCILYANGAAEDLFLAESGSLSGRLFGHPLVAGDSTEIEIVRPDRRKATAKMRAIPVEWEGRAAQLVLLHASGERRRAREPQRRSGELLHALVAYSPLAIVATDPSGRVSLWNRAAADMLGWSELETIGNGLPATADDPEESLVGVWAQAMHGEEVRGRELPEQRRRDGQAIALQVWAAQMNDAAGLPGGLVLMLGDVTQRRRVEAHLRRLVGHDALTGLPNRRQFRKQVERTLNKLSRRDAQPLLVLQLGVDRFKNINKSIGHGGGDRLLQALARRLAGALDETDLVARTGGDEFAVLLRDTHHPHDGVRVANKLLQHLATPFELDGQEIFVTVSIGIAVYPHDGRKAADLIHAADDAMDRAKQQGGNGCQFFTPDIDSDAREQLALENGLRHALERNELFLDYQPQYDLKSGRLAGVEALVRWRHPEQGIVSPGSFIPVAEGSGLIVPIGAWVLHEACRQLRAWDAAGLPPLRMAVNVSARQFFADGFKAEVKQALRASGVAPARLELELTESLLVRNAAGVIDLLHGLKALGVRLSIDDFGTGYSGLSYLVDLPIDTLKIDQSFVRRLAENQRYRAIVAAIGELAQGLDLKVIAEGVETASQLEYLRSVRCDEVQGFLLARPLAPDEVARLLR
ncbi:MAG: EAL domain-containing protein [Rhodocyclales bacterium]|nr:EAL domain-containing protein [Rhodocyclales bacterium]